MQDRFKFRVWDRKSGQYIYRGGIDMYYGRFQTMQMEDDKYLTVEQCTGKKDKNGKPIFEGDILYYEYENDEFVKILTVWADEKCQFLFESKDCFFEWEEIAEHCEVVGNVHENKNLKEKYFCCFGFGEEEIVDNDSEDCR